MSDEPPSESEKRALLFEDMARQIRLNQDAKFGGAFLLIPPGTDDEAIFRSLMLNQEEASIFWASVQTIANVAVALLDNPQRPQGFQRR
jgi:hypothetical protein